jgi:peptide/nickel transport system substrate-binding protein
MKRLTMKASKDGELKYSDLTAYDKSVVERAVSNGCSRRDALKLMAVTGVSLATAENLLSSAGQAMAATPKKGGSIRYAADQHGPADKVDPLQATASIDYSRHRATYNGLVQIGENLSLNPELAETFEPNKDATEWTFKLRKGVEFHDGSKMTADDVVYSMNRHLGEDSVSVIKAVFDSVKEWKKTGSHEVKAILNSPNSDMAALLASFQMKIVKQGSKGDWNGTGPFVMEEFEPGIKSVHRRNENYWREPAHLDVLEITAITDPIARVNALIAGDVNIITSPDPKAYRQIESADNARLLSIPAGSQLGICCLQNTLPGSNPDFVKGLQYIQDRERIVKRVLKGNGSVGNDTPIMSAHGRDFCSELPQRMYDPDKAKYHFKKSGISTADLYVAPVAAGLEEICLLAQANCAKIGFDLKLKKVPTDGYWGAVWMKEPLNVTNWNMRSTANFQMAVQFAPNAPWNDTFWNNARMGELLKLSLAETDPDKRHALYCEMQTLIHNEGGMVIPAFTNVTDAIGNDIHGIPAVPMGPVGGSEWPEFVWKA